MEKFDAGGNARKFGDHVGKINNHQRGHHEECDAQAVFFADEIAEPLAGHCAHAGRHLLHHDQGQGDGNNAPQKLVSEMRSGRRVGVVATCIIVDVRGNESRPYDCEQQQDPGFPLPGPFHRTLAYGISINLRRINEETHKGQPSLLLK